MERIVVYQTEGYGFGFPEKAGLLEFAAWLSGIIEQIPEEHRSSAWIEIGTTDIYGDDYPRMEIGYSQPSDIKPIEVQAQTDRPAFEITEAMIEAGFSVLDQWLLSSDPHPKRAVELIYRAMEAERLREARRRTRSMDDRV